jgi:hypothetical protein
MKNYLFLVAFTIGACALKSKGIQQGVKQNIVCVEGTILFPVPNAQGIQQSYDTGIVRVYSDGKHQLYVSPTKYDRLDENGKRITELKQHYIVHYTDSLYGYDYLEVREPKVVRMRLDSAFSSEWIVINKIYPYISFNTAKIVARQETKDSLFLDYDIYKKGDTAKALSLALRFAKKFVRTPVSLSKELDSIYQMKLVKATTTISPMYYAQVGAMTSSYTILSSLRQVFDFDEQKVKQYFKTLPE